MGSVGSMWLCLKVVFVEICMCLVGMVCWVEIVLIVVFSVLSVMCVWCKNVLFFFVSLSVWVVWFISCIFNVFLRFVMFLFMVVDVMFNCWVVVVKFFVFMVWMREMMV